MKISKGTVAVITGAGSGMGKALALQLAEKGCHLSLADIDNAALDALASELASYGAQVFTHELDVSNRLQFNMFAAKTIERFGKVDLLFNNAGVSLQQSILETSYKDFEWVMNINFWGIVYGTRAFLPSMLKNDKGCVINLSSILGLAGGAMNSAYAASKFAVRGYTESLRHELIAAHSKVTACCVYPGPVNTDLAKNSRFYIASNGETSHDAMVASFKSSTKMTAEKAAQIILQGVEKSKRRILVGTDAKVVDLTQRCVPSSYENIIYPKLGSL